MSYPEVPEGVILAVKIMLAVSLIPILIRFVKGPHPADRVLAADMFAFLSIGFVVMGAITKQSFYVMDASWIPAILAFLGTVGFAFYIQESKKK